MRLRLAPTPMTPPLLAEPHAAPARSRGLPWLHRCALASLALAATTAQAGIAVPVGWDEVTRGDLSNTGTAATFVTLAVPGTSAVVGTTGRAVTGGPIDRDYFSILVPTGFQLTALTLLPGTQPLGDAGFIAMMSGSSFTVDPNSGSAAGLLGFSLYGVNDIGNDLLPTMGIPSLGSSGFDAPLPAGAYSFWVQETGVGVATYGFAFTVTAVPEPATALTLLAGLGLLAAALRRR